MRRTSTIRGKMFLSILAIWILLTFSAGRSSAAGLVNLPCCSVGSDRVKGKTIIECFEQKPRGSDCPNHFYLVVLNRGTYCINPDSKWLQEKMEKGNLKCPQPQMH